MKIIARTSFETISRRILYGLNFMFSDFAPMESDRADEDSQKRLHAKMGELIDLLYADPAILELPGNADRAFDWPSLNNSDPGLDTVYKSIFKALYDFYMFLYIASLMGRIRDDRLSVEKITLREGKATYKNHYAQLLKKIGMDASSGDAEITISAKKDILESLKLLSARVPKQVNPWTPHAVVNFACCSFTDDFDFLLERIDRVRAFGGRLLEMQAKSLASGYAKSTHRSFGPSGFGFDIVLKKNIGGFSIGYNPRKYRQFYFGSLNSIGIKAMLEDFGSLNPDLKDYLIELCKPCNHCLACTKGGKNGAFAVEVEHGGKDHLLCPDAYSRHSREDLSPDFAAALFKYHEAQEKYGTVLKKRSVERAAAGPGRRA